MNIVIYGKEYCGHCKLAKAYLDERGIPYEYHSADNPETVQMLLETVSPLIKQVPVVLIDDVWIGGYDKLQKYINENVTFDNGEYKVTLNG